MFIQAILSAILAAALVPAKCPPPEDYPKPGPLHRYVVAATVHDSDPNDAAGAVCDDWGFEYYYQDMPDLYDGQRVTLIYNDSGTPDDLADDILEDILYSCPPGSPCHDD